MGEPPFTIVSFKKEDGSLAVIPSSWLVDGAKDATKVSRCYWPPFVKQESIDKAIVNCYAPETTWS